MNSGEGTYVCNLSPELQKVAKTELHEDPSRRAADIDAIRTWIKQQPHLHIRTDDIFILRFLRAAKFSLERTKEKIDSYYTVRNALPEWFGERNLRDPKTIKMINMGLCVPLNGYTKEGRKVVIWRSGIYDPKEFSVDDVMRVSHLMSDLLMLDEQVSIHGVEAINDMTGITLAHFTSFSLSLAKKSMTLLEATPVRFKGMHYWNPPSVFEKFYNLFKSIMKEKMKKRLHVHGSDLKSLQSRFPLEILPEEFGGTGGKMAEIAAAYAKLVLEHENYFLEDSKYKVDESKRPGKPKSKEDLFGTDGSFRKLDID